MTNDGAHCIANEFAPTPKQRISEGYGHLVHRINVTSTHRPFIVAFALVWTLRGL